jgi:hypothetical protein
MTPRRILVVGWLVVVLYAYPGYMSYDSVLQLLQARDGVYTGGHPPLMGVLWGITDSLIAGPLGMLVIQVTCFLAGAYLLLRRCMSERAAALCACVIAWVPPISAVLAVIWKDSQMTGFLALGAALLLSERRGVRLGGLALMFLATAMRYNALAITFPLVVLLFAWDPAQRWWKRHGIALGAWLLVTLAANVVNARLASDGDRVYLWHDALALADITGTLRYADDIPDDTLRTQLAGTPLLVTAEIQATARSSQRAEDLPERKVMTFGTGEYIPALWVTTFHLFRESSTPEERSAISRAWRTIVLGHPGAYLTYRWHVTRERIHLGDRDIPSGTYVWFTDVIDAEGSRAKTEHNAVTSKLQVQLHKVMLATGTSWLFRPWIYIALSIVMLGFARRHRDILALLLSGLANEAALFVLAPTVDYRYSVWLVASTLLAVCMLVGRRARRT